jgi:hypothetical protein
MRKSTIGVVVLVVAGLSALSFCQADAAMKFVKKAEVYKVMGAYAKALGVKCNFCHTKDKSQDYEDLAGEIVTKEELRVLVGKRTARAMQGVMMVYKKKEGKEYTCNTCHQGKAELDLE